VTVPPYFGTSLPVGVVVGGLVVVVGWEVPVGDVAVVVVAPGSWQEAARRARIEMLHRIGHRGFSFMYSTPFR
jgi:hypothetical protein